MGEIGLRAIVNVGLQHLPLTLLVTDSLAPGANLVTGLAKWFLFLPAESSLHLFAIRLSLRFALFLCLGLLICWLGQKLHASQRKMKVLSAGAPRLPPRRPRT
jgi:hypothetical protein